MSRKNSNIVTFYATDDIIEWLESQTNRSKAIVEAIKKSNSKSYKNYVNEQASEIFEWYCKMFDTSPTKYKPSTPRLRKLSARLKDSGADMLRQAITNTAASKFHRGENDRGWKADLDWIIKSYEQVEKLANLQTERVRKGPQF